MRGVGVSGATASAGGGVVNVKRFPSPIHVVYALDADGHDDYLTLYTDGVTWIQPGQRVAVYTKIDEGRVCKSFVSRRKKGRR